VAQDLEADLERLGYEVFIDVNSLHPGDNIPQQIDSAAQQAAVGLVLFNRDYVNRHWPVRELQLIMAAGTLLPVVIDMSHEEFEAAWHASAKASHLGDDIFTSIKNTVFIVDKGGWRGELRQKICLGVTRRYVKKFCDSLEDRISSAKYIIRALNASKVLQDRYSFKELTKRDLEEIDPWIASLEKKLGL
jgi:hypothetical protein